MRCRVCGKPLTGKNTITNIGPVCAKHRAEAMQPSLIAGTEPVYRAPVPTREEFKESEGFEVVDFDSLRGIRQS